MKEDEVLFLERNRKRCRAGGMLSFSESRSYGGAMSEKLKLRL